MSDFVCEESAFAPVVGGTLAAMRRTIRALPVAPDEIDRFCNDVQVYRVAGGYDHADSSEWRHAPGPDRDQESAAILDWQAQRNRVLDLRGGW